MMEKRMKVCKVLVIELTNAQTLNKNKMLFNTKIIQKNDQKFLMK